MVEDLQSKGRLVTRGLIYEYMAKSPVPERVKYTLRVKDIELPDGRLLKSLPKLYMEMSDPSEYLFATTYFESWHHWGRMLEIPPGAWGSKAFIEYVGLWRDELGQKLKAEAMQSIQKLSRKDGGLAAAKWIAEGNLSKPTKSKIPKRTKTVEPTVKEDNADLQMLKELNVK